MVSTAIAVDLKERRNSFRLKEKQVQAHNRGEPDTSLFRPVSSRCAGGRIDEESRLFLFAVGLAVSCMQGYAEAHMYFLRSWFTCLPPIHALSVSTFPPSQGGVARQPELPLRGLHENGRHQFSGVQAVRRGDEGQHGVPSLPGNQ